jgi:hypothetical protein
MLIDYREAFLTSRKVFMWVVSLTIDWLLFMPWCSQSSTMRVTHPRSSARRRRVSARSSTSRPYAFVSRLSSIFQRSQPTITESTELQQRSRQNISHHGPRVVEIAAVRDKQACLVMGYIPTAEVN